MKGKFSVHGILSGFGALFMIAGLMAITGCGAQKSDAAKDTGSFRRTFPETTEKTRVFADQLPPVSDYSEKQMKFIAKNYTGAQKMALSFTTLIRKYNPNFIMLHYQLAIWQSYVNYIIDGENWGNDLDKVSEHDDWFMHRFNPDTGEVYTGKDNWVYSFDDHKYLMNITNEDYYQYYKNKLIEQCKAGQYDGVFLDSYHTAVLNFYLQNYPEYTGTSAGMSTYPELGKNVSWKEASEKFMKRLTADLNKAGIYSLPNLGNFNTGWDTTDYTIPNGGMTEGAFNYGSLADWQSGMNGHLKLADKNLIDICQVSLSSGDTSFDERLYYLGNYLLLRGKYTYINLLSDNSSFNYFPEYDLDMGKPLKSAGKNIDSLKKGGLYVRNFKNGMVIVCPTGAEPAEYKVPDGSYKKVVLQGGGLIGNDGTISGFISFEPVNGSISLQPGTAAIIMKNPSVTAAYIPQLQAAVDYSVGAGEISRTLADKLGEKLSDAGEKLDNGKAKDAKTIINDCIRLLDDNKSKIGENARTTLPLYAKAIGRQL